MITTPRVLVPVLVTAVLLAGAGLSTVRYVALWHTDYEAKVYTRNVAAGARLHDLRVMEEWVPADVVSPLRFPDNYASRVFRQFPNIHALDEGNDLAILDEFGLAQRAEVEPGLVSRPGPGANCGYAISGRQTTIRLREPSGAEPLENSRWVSIDYIASGDAVLTARLGDDTRGYQVMKGLHQLFVKGEGEISSVTLAVPTAGVALCVDQIRVGKVHVWQPTT